MSFTLLIVESPHKSETIGNILKTGYKVIGSKGHIRVLPKYTYGYKLENDKFIPTYVIDKDKKDIIKTLEKLSKSASNIILATDDDREGEAIAWHICEVLKLNPNTTARAVFHEITKQGIYKGLENLRNIDMNLVNAQQARRLLDRIVGFKLSPLLSKKIESKLSAGRVQSPILKIIVDREREIQEFIPILYYEISCKALDLDAKLVSYRDKVIKKETDLDNEEDAKWIVENTLKNKDKFKVKDIVTKTTYSKPTPPFTTSTMQQFMNNNFGWPPTKTSSVAQKLYEGIDLYGEKRGLVTYIRTDSITVSEEAIVSARDLILNNFGSKYLPEHPNYYKNKSKNAQEAHEAIRPTNLEYHPDKIRTLIPEDEYKLYSSIYFKFLSSQMSPAEYRNKNIIITDDIITYKISGKITIFDGHTKVLKKKNDDIELPDIDVNSLVNIQDCSYIRKETQPPHRYTQAGVIKIMEEVGIGRPSTYSPTIAGLLGKNYVSNVNGSLVPNEVAFKIVSFLEEHFPDIVDVEFTALMEDSLDLISSGKLDWNEFLLLFYKPFEELVKHKLETIPDKEPSPTLDEKCPKCNSPLIIRKGRFGTFKGCSAYPRCKFIEKVEIKKEGPIVKGKCEKCGNDMVEKTSKWKSKFIACSNYPKCKNIWKKEKNDKSDDV
jgi:DNA topoisomerase I